MYPLYTEHCLRMFQCTQKALLIFFILLVVLLCYCQIFISNPNDTQEYVTIRKGDKFPPSLSAYNSESSSSSSPDVSKSSPSRLPSSPSNSEALLSLSTHDWKAPPSSPPSLPSPPSSFQHTSEPSHVVSLPNKNCIVKNNMTNELPKCVMDNIKTFVFFVGIGRSGHSIIGSLLDSHPHMVVAHESNLFFRLAHGQLSLTKPVIFNDLWKNTRDSILDNGLRAKSTNGKGYTLFIDDLYQGRYVDYIEVIGDKKGRGTTEILDRQPDKWLHIYNTLKSHVTTMKGIHVIRNPYDNIATLAFFEFDNVTKENFGDIKNSNKTFKFESHVITDVINAYFRLQRAIQKGIRTYNLDIIVIHNKNVILEPKNTLIKLCNFLQVTCSNEYLQICTNKIYKAESKTRHMIEWTTEQLRVIQQNIDKFSWFEGYNFNSL